MNSGKPDCRLAATSDSSSQDTNGTKSAKGGEEFWPADRARAWFPLHRSFRFRFHGFSRP